MTKFRWKTILIYNIAYQWHIFTYVDNLAIWYNIGQIFPAFQLAINRLPPNVSRSLTLKNDSSTVCCFCPLFRKTGMSVLIPISSKSSKESLKPAVLRDWLIQSFPYGNCFVWTDVTFCPQLVHHLQDYGSVANNTYLW
jgi:hypothetical protein